MNPIALKSKDSDGRGEFPLPERIMVVDDDPFVLEIVRAALSASGTATVQTYDTGAAAIKAARDFEPNLVVLDLLMPEIGGRQTWEGLRELLSPLPPVIFLTAHSDPKVLREVADLNPLGIIAKPFDPLAIEQKIRRLLESSSHNANAGRDRARLARVQEKFQQSLAGTARDLENLVARLQAGEDVKVIADMLYNKAHMLAGTAGMFQLNAVSEAAAQLERLAFDYVKAKALRRVEQESVCADLVAASDALQVKCREAAAGPN